MPWNGAWAGSGMGVGCNGCKVGMDFGGPEPRAAWPGMRAGIWPLGRMGGGMGANLPHGRRSGRPTGRMGAKTGRMDGPKMGAMRGNKCVFFVKMGGSVAAHSI